MSDISFNKEQMRYERKFLTSYLSKPEVEDIIRLHPASFSEIYHARYVNNIYFDTFSFSSYKENLGCISDRTKVRIRWYGEVFGYIEEPVPLPCLLDRFIERLLGRLQQFFRIR